MKKIQMVDLNSQYRKLRKEIDQAVQQVIDSSAFIKGPDVRQFENELSEYLDVKHVIACGNGTDALQIALMALDLKPGDEVITSNFTFISTIEVIAVLGLVPVLVDVRPDTFNIDPREIKKAITSNTKAVIPVHIFGQCAKMEEIMNIAEANDLSVVEDCAQAIATSYIFKNGDRKKAGTIGDIGCTSFFPSKNLGCFGDGGAIYSNNDELADRLRKTANHGTGVKYHHSMVGVNSRLDTLQAAVLRVKLKKLDDYTRARQQVAAFYNEAFKDNPAVTIPYHATSYTEHGYHQYTLLLNGIDRSEFQDYLRSKDIPTMVYYPVPFHLQEAYQYLPYKKGDFPVTEDICNRVVSLPMHTEMDEEQLEFIVRHVLKFLHI
jgi:dTDP-4-amino-4,6-dideoxygalactose transaminase